MNNDNDNEASSELNEVRIKIGQLVNDDSWETIGEKIHDLIDLEDENDKDREEDWKDDVHQTIDIVAYMYENFQDVSDKTVSVLKSYINSVHTNLIDELDNMIDDRINKKKLHETIELIRKTNIS